MLKKIVITLTAGVLFMSANTAWANISGPAMEVKPEFVLIHSAWMGGWSFEHIGKGLEEAGYRYHAPDLPAHGNDKTPVIDVSLVSYVQAVTDVIDSINAPVILTGHSFGGVVASQVAEARPEKVRAVNYLCAFMLPNGVSFMDATKGVEESKVLNNLVFSPDGATVSIAEEAIHEAVAHDVPEDVFLTAKPLLVPEPTRPLGEAVQLSDERYGSVPRYYTSCTADSAIPPNIQQAMFRQMEVKRVYELPSSHVPIFSMPDKVVDVLVDIARRTDDINADR